MSTDMELLARAQTAECCVAELETGGGLLGLWWFLNDNPDQPMPPGASPCKQAIEAIQALRAEVEHLKHRLDTENPIIRGTALEWQAHALLREVSESDDADPILSAHAREYVNSTKHIDSNHPIAAALREGEEARVALARSEMEVALLKKELLSIEAERDRLAEIVERLPKTRDGVPVTPWMHLWVWTDDDGIQQDVAGALHADSYSAHEVTSTYSTRAAAEAARAKGGA